MKNGARARAILTAACALLIGTAAAFAEDTRPADEPAATTAAANGAAGLAEIGPGAFLALLAEVRLLRIEVLEQRLDRQDERIAGVERELERVSNEMSRLEEEYDAMQQELLDAEGQLTDPDIDEAHRAYLEAMRKNLDGKQAGAVGDAEDRLQAEESELLDRLRDLRRERNRLANAIEALRRPQS